MKWVIVTTKCASGYTTSTIIYNISMSESLAQRIYTKNSGITTAPIFSNGEKILHIGSGSRVLSGAQTVDILDLPGVFFRSLGKHSAVELDRFFNRISSKYRILTARLTLGFFVVMVKK